MKLSEYVKFDLQPTPAHWRTLLWKAIAVGGIELGVVKWHTNWRKYCFFPNGETLYDPDCLFTIGDFCERKSKEHLTRMPKI